MGPHKWPKINGLTGLFHPTYQPWRCRWLWIILRSCGSWIMPLGYSVLRSGRLPPGLVQPSCFIMLRVCHHPGIKPGIFLKKALVVDFQFLLLNKMRRCQSFVEVTICNFAFHEGYFVLAIFCLEIFGLRPCFLPFCSTEHRKKKSRVRLFILGVPGT